VVFPAAQIRQQDRAHASSRGRGFAVGHLSALLAEMVCIRYRQVQAAAYRWIILVLLTYFDEVKYQPDVQPAYWLEGITVRPELVPELEAQVNKLRVLA
jgi:hypothetical protein